MPFFLPKVGSFGQCWSVSAVAQSAGLAALTCYDTENKVRHLIESEREYLLKSIEDIGIQTFPSDANFFMLRSSIPLYDLLLRQGILIRSCSNFSGLDDS